MKIPKLISMVCLALIFGCFNKQNQVSQDQNNLNISDSVFLEKITNGDTVFFLSKDKIVAMRVENPNENVQLTKYIDIFKSKYPYPNETIYFSPTGDIIEDSSNFYHCQQIGSDLLISWCFKSKVDSVSIKIDGDFDTYFTSHKEYDRIMFKGNNFLVKNYKQFAVKDTFRAIVAPRIKSYYENDELFHEIGMIFIEYPPQLDFSSIK